MNGHAQVRAPAVEASGVRRASTWKRTSSLGSVLAVLDLVLATLEDC